MLQKSKSTPASILKIAIIIPFLLTSVLYTSCNTDDAEQIEETIIIEEIKNSDQAFILDSETDVPFTRIEEVPHFEECTGTNAEIKKCTSDKITSFVNKNFNTGLAKDLSGRHKISVQFKIDQNGNVGISTKTPYTKLEVKDGDIF
jgi:protein TonB